MAEETTARTTEYLIRDDRTGKETWIAAENIRNYAL